MNKKFKKGSIYTGNIKFIKSDYVFVNLGNADCYVPRNEICYKYISNCQSVVKQNQIVNVLIEESTTTNIRGSIKKTKDLFQNHKYEAGQEVDYQVYEVNKDYLLVNAGEVPAYIHRSDALWYHSDSLNEKFSVGDCGVATILSIDSFKGRMNLSLKLNSPHPLEVFKSKYAIGDIVEGKIHKFIDKYSLFSVDLPEGAKGGLKVLINDPAMKKGTPVRVVIEALEEPEIHLGFADKKSTVLETTQKKKIRLNKLREELLATLKHSKLSRVRELVEGLCEYDGSGVVRFVNCDDYKPEQVELLKEFIELHNSVLEADLQFFSPYKKKPRNSEYERKVETYVDSQRFVEPKEFIDIAKTSFYEGSLEDIKESIRLNEAIKLVESLGAKSQDVIFDMLSSRIL
tara:strand:- start:32968 stop:34170 length:1203 start_codon:yes stop_codon:yes gene_type:complete